MDDVRAVMDAAGSERAALLGLSEGGPMSILFAATYPERTHRWSCAATFATGTLDPDENPAGRRWIAEYDRDHGAEPRTGAKGARSRSSRRAHASEHGCGSDAASSSARPQVRRWRACCSRCSPRSTSGTCCPASACRRWCSTAKSEFIPVESARYLAEHIPGARLVELPGADHIPFYGDMRTATPRRSRSSSPARATRRQPDRVLATVLFTDIVGSTERAARARRRALARAARRATTQLVRAAARRVPRPRGQDDGRRLPRHLRRARARDPLCAGDRATRCDRSTSRCAPACTPASAR